MGRSNTLPPPATSHKQKSSKLGRSNTVIETPKHHHHLPSFPRPHVPHHIPFIHHEKTSTEEVEPQRPAAGLNRQASVHTRYMNMLLAQDTIPRFHTILAAFFT